MTRLGCRWGNIAAHCTLLSKQGRRREKTLTEKEGTRTTRVTPPHHYASSPFYLLKLCWVGRGPAGPSFTPRVSFIHTQKKKKKKTWPCQTVCAPSGTTHAHKGREKKITPKRQHKATSSERKQWEVQGRWPLASSLANPEMQKGGLGEPEREKKKTRGTASLEMFWQEGGFRARWGRCASSE